jgi:DNA-binding transcriptional LysR family regulator
MDNLREMALFVEVARAMSFKRAAESLGVPNSTLSRRIADLERAVGVRLFNRTTRSN